MQIFAFFGSCLSHTNQKQKHLPSFHHILKAATHKYLNLTVSTKHLHQLVCLFFFKYVVGFSETIYSSKYLNSKISIL